MCLCFERFFILKRKVLDLCLYKVNIVVKILMNFLFGDFLILYLYEYKLFVLNIIGSVRIWFIFLKFVRRKWVEYKGEI